MNAFASPLLALHVVNDTQTAEAIVADIVAAEMTIQKQRVLGLATGRSMLGVYRRLVQLYESGAVSFGGLTSFNLDEYCGLDAHDPSSFTQYMKREFFGMIDADPTLLHLPGGNHDQSGARYEAMIEASGGIDLQLLGIGQNGHIGFNEPGSPMTSRTRMVELAPRTRLANSEDFPNGTPVPTHAVTMGISTILESRRIVLLATSAAKADALAQALEGPVGPHCPASFLQKHRDLTVVCDRPAAARLQRNTEHNHG